MYLKFEFLLFFLDWNEPEFDLQLEQLKEPGDGLTLDE
jgi:hypothetical protein